MPDPLERIAAALEELVAQGQRQAARDVADDERVRARDECQKELMRRSVEANEKLVEGRVVPLGEGEINFLAGGEAVVEPREPWQGDAEDEDA